MLYDISFSTDLVLHAVRYVGLTHITAKNASLCAHCAVLIKLYIVGRDLSSPFKSWDNQEKLFVIPCAVTV